MNLRQLADSLGLSMTTVSRALNGYPEVREETRARVLAAAKAANYTPNARARRLATGRAMTIGHVVPLTGREETVNPIFSDFLAGAGEVYAREGYDLLLSMVAAEAIDDTYRNLAATGSVDGVMVQSPRVEDHRISLLQDLKMPFLVHGRTGDYGAYSWLDIANIRAFRRATEFLLDLGHRRIALINGQETLDFAARRRKGMEEALATRGVTTQPDWVHQGVMTEQYGFTTTRTLLADPVPPTAIMCSSIIPAMGARRAIAEAGLVLGRDVSIICHDDELSYLGNDALTSPAGPPFTATRSSIRAAGATLCRDADRPDPCARPAAVARALGNRTVTGPLDRPRPRGIRTPA
ncbi:Transcriptional regulator AglR, LacI family [Roseibacterium elongatum DSM 19469]|uniref:Transcriptional regulator AglR, LacI family n=1 Tax=Roseicyclus elongatus DSM 19469 TaxID=1294273 RepID=W8RVX2_9RHOB|nr:Transcriptional regulator AglR, LacI family [Roseibacterium elongatum DSM 19469]